MSLLNCRPHTTIGGTMPKDYPRCQARTRASLAKEGWLRPLRKSGEASLAGADGVVRSSTDDWKLNEPPRPRQSKERDHLLDGASTPPLPRSIQSCPAGQRQNTQETAPSKTKDLSAQFLERGVWTYLLP